jgi:hypothetical protein
MVRSFFTATLATNNRSAMALGGTPVEVVRNWSLDAAKQAGHSVYLCVWSFIHGFSDAKKLPWERQRTIGGSETQSIS